MDKIMECWGEISLLLINQTIIRTLRVKYSAVKCSTLHFNKRNLNVVLINFSIACVLNVCGKAICEISHTLKSL